MNELVILFRDVKRLTPESTPVFYNDEIYYTSKTPGGCRGCRLWKVDGCGVSECNLPMDQVLKQKDE